MKKTAAEYIKAWRGHLKARGYVRPEIYVHREDVPALKTEAERLRKRRERKSAKEVVA